MSPCDILWSPRQERLSLGQQDEHILEIVCGLAGRNKVREEGAPAIKIIHYLILGNIHWKCDLLIIRKSSVGNIHWKCNLFLIHTSSAPNIDWKFHVLQSPGLAHVPSKDKSCH